MSNMTAADIVVAARDFGDLLMKRVPVVALKSCSRCDGIGFATAMSATRSHWNGAYKKVCFNCGGSGTVAATREAKAVLVAAHAANDLERIRVLFRGYTMAISILEAQVDDGSDWGLKHDIKSMREALARTILAGKAAAKAHNATKAPK